MGVSNSSSEWMLLGAGVWSAPTFDSYPCRLVLVHCLLNHHVFLQCDSHEARFLELVAQSGVTFDIKKLETLLDAKRPAALAAARDFIFAERLAVVRIFEPAMLLWQFGVG